MKIKACLLSVILSLHAFLFSQNRDLSFDGIKENSTELIEAYPGKKAITYYSLKTYDFFPNTHNKLIEVVERQSDYYVGLANHSTTYGSRYYDSYSAELKDFNFKKSNSDIDFRKRCGDFEIDGIFFHDNKECVYKIEFPKPGESATVNSKIYHSDSRYLTNIYFDDQNFLVSGEILLFIPESVDIEILEYNLDGFDISKEVTNDDGYTTITYQVKNLESIAFDNIAGPSWVIPHLVILSKGFSYEGEYYSLFDTNENLYRWLSALLPVYHSDAGVEKIVESMDVENEPDSVKMKAALNWVQKNIRYVAYEDGIAGFKPSPVEQVIKDKYADCKGMSNLLYFILKDLGIDARRCWVGTDRLAYINKFPSLISDNHVICAVKTDSGFIFLDPTDTYSVFGEGSEYIQSKLIAIEDVEQVIIDTIPATTFNVNRINTENEVLLDSGILKINTEKQYRGVNRKKLQYLINDYIGTEKEKKLGQMITNDNSKLVIDTLSYEYSENGAELEIDYNMSGRNMVFKKGSTEFVPLDYENNATIKSIDTSRKVHYSLGNRMQEDYETVFTLNKNQKIEYLPKDSTISFDGFAFQFSWNQEGDKIIYKRVLDIKNRIVDVESFSDWNSFVEEYNKLKAELIIISEKNEFTKN